jgi:PKD repeat protein
VALAAPDLKVVSAVPTQGTDDPARLVAGRPTAVRVKVRSSAPRTLSVPLRITATFETPGGEVTRTSEKDVTLRGGQTSYQHVGFDGVPEAGTMKVTAELDPDEHQPDSDRTNNTAEAQRSVVAAKRFHVLFVPVRAQGDDPLGCGRVQRVAAGAERFLKASWPIDPRSSAFDVDCSNPWVYPDGLDDAGVAGIYNDLDLLTLIGDYDRVVAVVPDGWFSRLANANLHNAAGMAPYDTLGRSAIVEARAMGGWVTAHEIAHELGWASAAAGQDGHLVDTPAQGYWVTEKRQILDDVIDAEHPTATVDEIRDDTARWTSDLTWDFVSARLNGLPPGPGPKAAATAQDGPVLAVSGIATGDGATLSSVAAVDGTADADAPSGDLAVEQRDAGGDVVATQRFRSGRLYGSLGVGADVPHQPSASAPFSVRAPLAAGAESVRIMRGTTVLAQRAKSAHAPVVAVTAPAAGASINIGGPLKITWNASDADGDPLRSSVQVSTDGTTWRPVAVDLTGGELTITASAALSGNAVRVRVITTDGWQTTTAQSGPFTVRGGLVDGLLVVTGGDPNGKFQTAEPDGSDLKTLPVEGWWPSWSPDGRRLAFHAFGGGSIGSAAADGSDQRIIGPSGSYYARWLGPETVGFYSSGGTRAGWYTVHDDPTQDYTKFASVGQPCDLSLDGSLLLLRQNESLALANVDGSGAKKIPNSSMRYTGDACGSLSPDAGQAVAEDYDDIAVWDVTTGKRTNLTHDGDGRFPRDSNPVFSPSGKWIYYLSTRDRVSDHNDVWRIHPDGTGDEKVLDGDRNHNHLEDTGDVSYDWVEVQPRYLADPDAGAVAPVPPVADAGGPYTVDEGAPVTVDAAGSHPGEGGAAIAARRWDLDGDGAYDDADTSTAQRTFADDGTYTPGLLVTAADGLTSSTTAQVVVRNVAPSLHDLAVAPTIDERVAATATIADPGADDTFTATVDWHDGKGPQPAPIVQDAGGRRVIATHDPIAGASSVTIQVSDDDGGKDVATAAIAAPPANGAPTLEPSSVDVAYGQQGAEFSPKVSDPENETVHLSVVTAPEHGTLVERRPAAGDVTPRLTYRPLDGFMGSDKVVLRATDGTSTTGPAQVTFQVAGPPEAAAPGSPSAPAGPAGDVVPHTPGAGVGNRLTGASAPGAGAGASLDAVVRPGDAIVLRSSKQCASRRSFPVRIVRPKALAPYRRIRVRVNGKLVRDVRKPSKAARAAIDLRGLPKGKAAIDVEVTLASGRVIHQKRTYRTCTAKRAVKHSAERGAR